MTTPTGTTAVEAWELTEQQAWEVLNRTAQHYLGISGEEFLRRYDAGVYDEQLEDAKVLHVVMLTRLVR